MELLTDEERAGMSPETQRMNEAFRRVLIESGIAERLGMIQGRQPSYRYFTHRQWQYCWTTERMDDGKFAAFIYKPVGKGSQTGRARSWEKVKELRFAKRNTAKARALKWYETAKTKR